MNRRDCYWLFVLICFFSCCVAPRCFECNQDEYGCGDHFGKQNTEALFCDGSCLKRRGERYSDSVRRVEITRTCIVQTSDGCYDTTWNGISVRACACNTDYCNKGNTMNTAWNFPVHLIISVSVYLVSRYNASL